ALAVAAPETDTSASLWSNLDLLSQGAQRRGLRLPSVAGLRAAVSSAEAASAGQVAALEARIDAVEALIQGDVAPFIPDLRQRLEDRRAQIRVMRGDDVLEEGQRLDGLVAAIETMQQTLRLLPPRPTGT